MLTSASCPYRLMSQSVGTPEGAKALTDVVVVSNEKRLAGRDRADGPYRPTQCRLSRNDFLDPLGVRIARVLKIVSQLLGSEDSTRMPDETS
jgi:hypothetical protein